MFLLSGDESGVDTVAMAKTFRPYEPDQLLRSTLTCRLSWPSM
jgi:hypothetical protein